LQHPRFSPEPALQLAQGGLSFRIVMARSLRLRMSPRITLQERGMLVPAGMETTTAFLGHHGGV
jgi:hypothetical protein